MNHSKVLNFQFLTHRLINQKLPQISYLFIFIHGSFLIQATTRLCFYKYSSDFFYIWVFSQNKYSLKI
jgi:hypothetical protein